MRYNWRLIVMKRFLLIIVGIMLCTWMTSCYTTQNVLLSSQELRERYNGKTRQEIIQMMGPPTRVTTDGGDGSILVYEEYVGSTTKVTSTKVTDNNYISRYNTTSQENYSWFYMDSKGVCTNVKSNCLTKRAKAYNEKATVVLVTMSILTVGLTVLFLVTVK